MRKGLRGLILLTCLALHGVTALAAPRPFRNEAGPVRLTVEVAWSPGSVVAAPTGTGLDVLLRMSEGRVVDVCQPPESDGGEPPGPVGETGAWRLGREPEGRVRVRVEAPVSANLLIEAEGRLTQIPLIALLEGPQRTLPDAPLALRVERLPWDALEVHLAEGDGTTAPGAKVPLALGFNILTPEPTDVAIRYWAELRPIRGGPPEPWRVESVPEVMASNALNPPSKLLIVPAPKTDGTYVLEVRAIWEPVEALEGSRLSRWLRRKRNGPPMSATRRLTLVVLGPSVEVHPTSGTAPLEVDSVDLGRLLGVRPVASGRAPGPADGSWAVPEAALVEAGLRDRVRGWINRSGGESGKLEPANGEGLAWSALGLKVRRPGRPHRLSVTVTGGQAQALGVALVAPGLGGQAPRLLLDACASEPAGVEAGKPKTFTWTVWPDAPEAVLVLANRATGEAVRVGSVVLSELPADLAPATLGETHPQAPRSFAVQLSGPGALARFGGWVESEARRDVLSEARNLAAYLEHLGASSVVLPVGLADRETRLKLDGQASEDGLGPDRLELLLRILGRRKLQALLDVRFDDRLPGLPMPGSPEARARGLVRLDAQGHPDPEAPVFQTLHPEVGAALNRLVAQEIAPRLAHPNLAGLLVRLGPGPTLPGAPDMGLDDATYLAFVRAMFQAEAARQVPGQGTTDPNRFEARARFVAGAGRKAWLEWRAEKVGTLYAQLAESVRSAAPGAVLAVTTPGLDAGPAGSEAHKADRAGLPPNQAWRALGLDLDRWPSDPGGPVVLRGVGLGRTGLAHDLATSPELDAPVAARASRGVLLGPEPESGEGLKDRISLHALPMPDDEPIGHALAVLDPRWLVVDASAAAGREDRLAKLSRVFRALPSPSEREPATPRLNSGVAVRTWTVEGRTYLEMANDTPYEILQTAIVKAPAKSTLEDLGRDVTLEPVDEPSGGKKLVLRLPPFGVAAVRVSAPEVAVEPKAPYLPSLARLDTLAEELSEKLAKLGKGDRVVGPPMAGFEPPGSKPVVAEIRADAEPGDSLNGWSLAGEGTNDLTLDATRPHAGLWALRLDAKALPASATSEDFLPPTGSTMLVRSWLRSDHADSKVRVWIEGEAGGEPLVRHADVPVGLEWGERAVRVPSLPDQGLDSLRLRFEWLGPVPGSVWVDDVDVQGQGTSESDKRVQRLLAEAVQAYRLKRYADFARLAGSRRVRELAPEGVDPVRTGQATDLPAGRRLR